MLERRFTELRADGRRLSGVMPYDDVARLPWGAERFEAGAFGPVGALDVILNLQHERSRMLARTGGGGLVLVDGPRALEVRAELPPTRDAEDALVLVRAGVLRGISIEFAATRERHEGRVRVVEGADLSGLGLVDRPAYPGALVAARMEGLDVGEVRAEGDGLVGSFAYGVDTIVADRAEQAPAHEERQRAGVRKQRVRSGAFRFAMEDPGREINLVLGRSYDRPLASKLARTLELEDSERALNFRVERLPDTSYVRDFRAQMTGGAARFGVAPLFRIPPPAAVPNAVTITPEAVGSDVLIEEVNEAVLTGLAVVTRAPRGNPGHVARRRIWW